MTDELQSIRDRFNAIIPGPWRWLGNTATDQVYLATNGRGRLTILMPTTRTEEYVWSYRDERGYTLAEISNTDVRRWCGAHETPDEADLDIDLEWFLGLDESPPSRAWRVLDWVDEVWAAFDAWERSSGSEWECICEEIAGFLRGELDPAEGHRTFDWQYVNSDHPLHGQLVRGVQVHADLRFPDRPNSGWTEEAIERRKRHGGTMISYRKLARYEVLGRTLDSHFHDYRTRAEYEAEEHEKTVQDALYREDFCSLAQPEAEFIERAPEDIGFLLNLVNELLQTIAEQDAQIEDYKDAM